MPEGHYNGRHPLAVRVGSPSVAAQPRPRNGSNSAASTDLVSVFGLSLVACNHGVFVLVLVSV